MINSEIWPILLMAIPSLIAVVTLILLVVRSRHFNQLNDDLDKQLALSNQQMSHLNEQREELIAQKNQLVDVNSELSESITEMKADYAVMNQQQIDARRHFEDKAVIQQRQADEKIDLLQDAREQMTKEFNLLANKILDDKAKHWREDSKQSMDAVLTPLRDQLSDFRKKVEDVYDKESKERGSLLHEIGSLKSLNQQMSHRLYPAKHPHSHLPPPLH